MPPGASGGAVGGGWFGYLSYPDAGRRRAVARASPRPRAAGRTACCARTATASGGTKASPAQHFPSGWPRRCRLRGAAATLRHRLGRAPTGDAHRRGVLACLEAIAAGEVYQACVCTQFAGRLDGAPIDFFVDAVARTSPARAAYLAGDWGAVASLSPELFLRRCGEAVTSSPIKGTLPRHADPAALRASVKDVAENIMIVDLVRNDLGRVARHRHRSPCPNCWRCGPRRACGIWCRRCRRGSASTCRWPRVLDATFPPASVTGTPKARARRAADRLGAASPRSLLRHSRFGVTGRGL